MTNTEKRNNARSKVVDKIIDGILFTVGAREIVEGPRGSELLELMRKDTLGLIVQYENKYSDE